MTGLTGTLIATMMTKPFGEPHYSGAPTDYQFTGKELDDTGLYYFAARYYDASVGRFTSQDTWVGSLTQPWTQNMYVYVGNNPLRYVDPTGNMPELDPEGGGGGGIPIIEAIGAAKSVFTMATLGVKTLVGTVAAKISAAANYLGDIWDDLVNGVSGLSEEIARAATRTGGGVQHGYRHVKDLLGGANWSKPAAEHAYRTVERALMHPDAVAKGIEMSQGKQVVDIYLLRMGESWLAVYYNPATQQVVTTVPATANQLIKWGVVK